MASSRVLTHWEPEDPAFWEQKGRKILTLAEAVRDDAAAQKYLSSEVKKFVDSIFKK